MLIFSCKYLVSSLAPRSQLSLSDSILSNSVMFSMVFFQEAIWSFSVSGIESSWPFIVISTSFACALPHLGRTKYIFTLQKCKSIEISNQSSILLVQNTFDEQDDEDDHCQDCADRSPLVIWRRASNLVDLSSTTVVDPVALARADNHLLGHRVRAAEVWSCDVPYGGSLETGLVPVWTGWNVCLFVKTVVVSSNLLSVESQSEGEAHSPAHHCLHLA